jgi:hypothetical protein
LRREGATTRWAADVRALLALTLVAFWLLPVTSARAAIPSVTSFAPGSGPTGTTVVVTGTGFTGATDVTFNGVAASFTEDSDVQITTTVPAGATTGPIAVTTLDGTGTSAEDFVVIVSPVISDFSPSSGHFRQLVVITGSGFTGTTSVRFNGRPATFNVVSNGQIRARVPSGAGTGRIRVTNAAGSDLSSTVFRFLRFQHRVVVSMQLSGHLRALGRVNVPDGTRLCRARRPVIIQRFISGRFRFVARGRSQLDGDYRIAVGDKAGRYRAFVAPKLTPNHRCRPDVSLVRTHEHAPSGGGGGGGGGGNCHPSYPDFCIPPPPPDLDCSDIGPMNFTVLPPDPHGFDGNDNDGRGCETS